MTPQLLILYLTQALSSTTPSITLNTPTNASTTATLSPQLKWTGIAGNGQNIPYEFQLDTVNTFNSVGGTTPLIDAFSQAGLPTSTTYTATTTWVCPVGVTSVDVEVWGAGGGGGGWANTGLQTPTGGGGGAYSKQTSISVTPGTSYTVTVGTGGTAGIAASGGDNSTDGGDSWFSTTGTVLAKGGQRGRNGLASTAVGAGGATASGVGTTKFAGGSGANPGGSTGGGGGGGAGSAGAGGTADASGNGGTGGTGDSRANTAGGAGGIGNTSPGGTGATNGGGGGGATWSAGNGGPGARGQLIITYSTNATTGFADITNGANPSPYVSGDQVGFTVPSALTNGTVYYWRVRAMPVPGNTNYLQGWSSTFSFTAGSGGTANTKSLTASLSLTGGFTKGGLFFRSMTAALSFAGTFARLPIKKFAASLGLTGGQVGPATPTYVQTATLASDTSTGTTMTFNFPSSITAGNMVYVQVDTGGNNSINSVSDGQGSYTAMTGQAFTGVATTKSFYGLARTGSAGATLTIGLSGSNASPLSAIAMEFSGVLSYEGGTQPANSSGTSLSTSYTTTNVNDLLIGTFMNNTAADLYSSPGWPTNAASIAAPSDGQHMLMQYNSVIATGSYSSTVTAVGGGLTVYQVQAFRPSTVTIPALKLSVFKRMTAGLGFVGTFAKSMYKIFAGVLSFLGGHSTGGHFNYLVTLVAASLGFTGSHTKLTATRKTASVSFVGAHSKRTTKAPFTAGLSFSGLLSGFKQVGRVFSAGLSFVGNMSKGSLFFRTLTAALSFTGVTSLPKNVKKAMTASVSFVGAIKRAFTKTSFTAALSFTGNMFKRSTRSLTAGLSFVGAWVYHSAFFRNFTAAVGFTGAFKKFSSKKLTAGLSFTGAFKKARRVVFAAVLGFAGNMNRRTRKSMTATLSFTALMLGHINSFFTSIGVKVETTITNILGNSSSNVVIDETNDTIRTVESDGNISEASSQTNTTIVSSETNKTEVGK